MPSLKDFHMSDIILSQQSEEILRSKANYCYLYNSCMNDIDLFPNIRSNEIVDASSYVNKWIEKLKKAMEKTYPSSKIASGVQTLPDPVINIMLKQKYINLSEDCLLGIQEAHNLCMNIENIQGELLEEFIARNIEEYGWIWCRGSIIRSVDFYHLNSNTLLQIKNKYNTENSSSITVRNGRTIEKWNRIGKPLNGENTFNWRELNNKINERKLSNNQPNIELTEEKYETFIKMCIRNNPMLLIPGNYWDNLQSDEDEIIEE
ncbi:SinI family restriction endonuclease [Fusobacterium sp.]|uniref:SinI family restriction endonuclease n=1 Tax=Fusobacterium sp. TaxID=68766 RepID=UPI002901B8CE|nr:SinI family restriction endonuclease [Fusobacterium sp.]MDU1911926.1 SinI family restriction endonuclease [Fusobacterium sp.]